MPFLAKGQTTKMETSPKVDNLEFFLLVSIDSFHFYFLSRVFFLFLVLIIIIIIIIIITLFL